MPKNFTSLAELAPYNQKGRILKYSMDGGKTWTYVKLLGRPLQSFERGGNGYPANAEVSGRGTHAYHSLTERDFRRGMIVRLTTDREVKGKKWSYE